MASERTVREVIDRSLAIVGRYHDAGGTDRGRALLYAEVATIVSSLVESRITQAVAEERIVRPVIAAIIARYGQELGRRLHIEYLDNFDQAWAQAVHPAVAGSYGN